ncbi:MAG: hypothetical protein QXG57_06170 [Thermofilaceae archaeon]
MSEQEKQLDIWDEIEQVRDEIAKSVERKEEAIKAVREAYHILELARKPREIVSLAAEAAQMLMEILRKNPSWVVVIEGREYLTFPAFQTLASFFSLYPTVTEIRELRNAEGFTIGFEVVAEVRNRFGETLTKAVARCDRNETMPEYEYVLDARTGKRVRGKLLGYKKRFDERTSDHVVLAIAQTRAMRRALAQLLSFVPALAGFAEIPAEEVTE